MCRRRKRFAVAGRKTEVCSNGLPCLVGWALSAPHTPVSGEEAAKGGLVSNREGREMEYRCVYESEQQVVRQVVLLATKGYRFYVQGSIPEHKDPAKTDRKIVEQYGLSPSKWQQARRKKQGLANVQYLRWGREFLIMATRGEHSFFHKEAGVADLQRKAARIGRKVVRRRYSTWRGMWQVVVGPLIRD